MGTASLKIYNYCYFCSRGYSETYGCTLVRSFVRHQFPRNSRMRFFWFFSWSPGQKRSKNDHFGPKTAIYQCDFWLKRHQKGVAIWKTKNGCVNAILSAKIAFFLLGGYHPPPPWGGPVLGKGLGVLGLNKIGRKCPPPLLRGIRFCNRVWFFSGDFHVDRGLFLGEGKLCIFGGEGGRMKKVRLQSTFQ